MSLETPAVPSTEDTATKAVDSVVAKVADARPEWLDSKFASVEDQAKAYIHAQKLLGKRDQENDDDAFADDAVDEAEETDPTASDSTDSDDASAEVDLSAYAKEVDGGNLSDASREKIKQEFGLSDEEIDSHVASYKATGSLNADAMFAAAGIKDRTEYAKITTWASKNLTKPELIAYNKAVQGKDPSLAQLAVEGLASRFKRKFGKTPNLVAGQAGADASPAFATQEEMMAAMGDDRYAKDPAFRASVAKRVARGMKSRA